MVDKETMVHNEFTIIMIMIIRTPSPTPCTLTADGVEAREDTDRPSSNYTTTGYKGGELACSPTTWCYFVNMRGLSLVSDLYKM